MSGARSDSVVITVCVVAWVAIYIASAQGLLHVSWMVSDGLLALLALMIAYRLWRMVRRRGRKRG